MSTLQWVGHEEVAREDIFGEWKRFTYYCNGYKQYIYCHNKRTFLELFCGWLIWARGKYFYTLDDLEGDPIFIQDIIMDRPEGTTFRVKCLINTQVGEYIQ